MALIKCPECGKENVSDSAEICPMCGFPIKKHFERTNREKLDAEQEYQRLLQKEKAYQEEQKRLERMCSPEAQRETVAQLKKQKNKANVSLLGSISAIAVSFIMFLSGIEMENILQILCIPLGIAFFILSIFWLSRALDKRSEVSSDLFLASRNMKRYYAQIQRRQAEKDAMWIRQLESSDSDKPLHHDRTIHCPKCNSPQISTTARGYSIVWGFIGADNTVNRCAKCGYKWKPRI